MALLDMTVPGDPMQKQRPRFGNGRTYTPAETVNAELVIGTLARNARRGQPPTKAAVGIALEFYCATRAGRDADNLAKLVMDALSKVVYVDDRQIEELFVRVHRGVGAKNARTEVFVWTLPVE
jgi:Holliday junction resolvase RusA-like endonuclease